MSEKTIEHKKEVQKYYGEILKSSKDLQTNACCTAITYPNHIKNALKNIHPEVIEKYYGCGLCVPENLDGCTVLDLGSGSGRDCYLLSQLVGSKGSVVGVDMTKEQLAVANKHLDFHAAQFGYPNSNVTFLEGDIQNLETLGLKDNSFDVIISNCVINLVADKKKVLDQVFRLLKPGGEFYFSDVYCDRRIPSVLTNDPVLYGECLSGALYWNDFENLAKYTGFSDPRVIESAPITVNNKELENKISGFNFVSTTYRLFKILELEPDCEDYGQAVKYLGSSDNQKLFFTLDQGHIFQKGKIELVCGNTYRMLQQSRFSKHFEFYGSWDTHFGIFDCGPNKSTNLEMTTENISSGCC